MARNLLILILVLLIGTALAATTGGSSGDDTVIYMQGVIRDQAPNTMFGCGGNPGTANNSKGFYNTDFQMSGDDYDDNEWGLCGDECNINNGFTNCGLLGADFTPVYRYSGRSANGNVHSPASFYHWFHSTEQNIPLTVDIALKQASGGRNYVYSNEFFFPIDNRGWSDWCYNNSQQTIKHNFGFCMEAHTRFGYVGGETFKFFGDDDLWVYIDSKLVIDLGSLHPKASKQVSLDSLPFLSRGNNYRLDFFYCERHTSYSRLELTTGISFYCSYEDWCGMCEGTGQSCCTPAIINQYCNDNDDCTVDTCGVQVAPSSGRPEGCVHTPISNCTAPDQCHQAVCRKQGGCQITTITCNDNNKCTTDSCNPSSGCVFSPITCDDNSKCTDDTCIPATGCQFTPKVCNDSNACTVDTCVNSTGCAFTPRPPCNDNSKCTADSCDPVQGCVFTDLCPVPNPCMVRTCNPSVGCSLNPKTCGTGLKCVVDSCNNATGACSAAPFTCPDLDSCHTTSCSNTSGCSYSDKNCDLGAKCMVYSCDTSTPNGCKAVARSCEDNNPCTLNLCSNSTGCYYPNVTTDDGMACTNDGCGPSTGVYHTPVVCNDNNLCTVDTCKNSSGCVFTPQSCDDNDPCTDDGCNPSTGCTHDRLQGCTTCMLAGSPINCTTVDKCFPQVCNGANGGCKNGTAVNCSDGNACTQDICTNGVCSNNDIPCLPNHSCDIAECGRTTGCVHRNKSCDDGNPCTADACGLDGNCTNTLIDKFCTVCKGNACAWSDPCNPKTCIAATGQCQVTPFNCNDNSACTNDTCTINNSGPLPVAVCSNPAITCANSGDVCNPNVCDRVLGCRIVPVVCQDSNKCTNDTCANVGGKATCLFPGIECDNSDPCNPQSCSEVDGLCKINRVSCNDFDACTNDSCVANGTEAVCVNAPYNCGADTCGAKLCNSTTGTCTSYQTMLPVLCNDGNPCTDDVGSCTGTGYACNNTLNSLCDDNNVCTNDVCNGQNATSPCSRTDVVCLPKPCQVVVGCDHVNGCIYTPLQCPPSNNTCKIPQCDITAGCIETDLVCTVDDPDCYAPTCDSNNAKSPCGKRKRSGWIGLSSNNGQLCAFRYDATARKAAIGTGAAIGIAIGAAAAVGIFGYGGKKGYDMLKMMREQRFDGVQNNPLYETNANNGDNPLYRYSVNPNST